MPQKISLKNEVPGGPIVLQTHPHREVLSLPLFCHKLVKP